VLDQPVDEREPSESCRSTGDLFKQVAAIRRGVGRLGNDVQINGTSGVASASSTEKVLPSPASP
jgi:hypothetical protein